jgi:hypothetical protein
MKKDAADEERVILARAMSGHTSPRPASVLLGEGIRKPLRGNADGAALMTGEKPSRPTKLIPPVPTEQTRTQRVCNYEPSCTESCTDEKISPSTVKNRGGAKGKNTTRNGVPMGIA